MKLVEKIKVENFELIISIVIVVCERKFENEVYFILLGMEFIEGI